MGQRGSRSWRAKVAPRLATGVGILGLTAAALAGGKAITASREAATLREHKAGLADALQRQTDSARSARLDRADALIERDRATAFARRSSGMFVSALDQAGARKLAGKEVDELNKHLTARLTSYDAAIRRLQEQLQRGRVSHEDLAKAHGLLGELRVMGLVFAAHSKFPQSQGAQQLHDELAEALRRRNQYVR